MSTAFVNMSVRFLQEGMKGTGHTFIYTQYISIWMSHYTVNPK